jgi:pyruvate/2-oxoglutarate dehydrogenase complex dihydrolipoamide acyltransferase (E2) component
MADLEFRLPKLGMSITEAGVVEWLVAVGDTVQEGQDMVVIEMDKAQSELPAPIGGTVVALSADEGDVIEVGDLLAVIRPSEG